MSNITTSTNNTNLKTILGSDAITVRLQEILGRRAPQFSSSILSAVSSNQTLSQCDPMTIVQAAMQAAVLDLPIQQNFGFAYLIPFYNSKGKKYECQFQMGYKGYIQLAIRTGLYEKINVFDIREGELAEWNPIDETLKIQLTKDPEERMKKPVIGYAGYIKMLNGFTKTDYWTLTEVMEHANKYSAQYRKYRSGMWVDQLDAMAKKTVIKNLLNKWGALSVEMQRPNEQLLNAIQADQAVIRAEEEYDYVDKDDAVVEVEAEEIPPKNSPELKIDPQTQGDAQTVKEEGKNPKKGSQEEIAEEETITEEQQRAMFQGNDPELVKKVMQICGYKASKDILKKDYKVVMEVLKKHIDQAKEQEKEKKEG